MENNLGDLTQRTQLIGNARAYWQYQIAKTLGGFDGALMILSNGGRLDRGRLALLEKAAVAPLTTTTAGGGAELAPVVGWRESYIALADSMTALFNLGATSTRLNTQATTETSSVVFDWVGENLPIPATAMVQASALLPPTRLGGIRVVSEESLRYSTPSVQAAIQHDNMRALAIGTDRGAFDPDLAASAGVRPASLTNAGQQITLGGIDVEAAARDCLSLIGGGTPARPVFVCNGRIAAYLSALRTSSGFPMFPQLGATGGTILGVQVLVSAGPPDILVAVDGSGVTIADGGFEMSMAREAAVQMDSAPAAGGAARVALLQAGMFGIKSERHLNFTKRADAVAWVRLPIAGSPAGL